MTESVAITSASLHIREPRESEFAACRILLPDAAAHPTGRVFRLALDASKPSIAGALSYQDDTQSLTNVRLHVVKTRRNSGIGSFLLNYILEEARLLGRHRVVIDADLKSDPQAEPFLTARGFGMIGRLTSVRGPMVGRGPNREQFLARLAGAEELPVGARLMGISEAPLDQILQLFSDHIANLPMHAGMLRTFKAEQYPESIVVMVGEKVIGFILAQAAGEVLRVPALVVLPEYRGKRLAIRMIAALENRLREDVQGAEFEFADSAIFTAKLAAQFGHEVVRIGARFERSL